MSRAKVFLLIGPSGAGKNTLINAILARRDDIRYVPSTTSRPRRAGESEGRPYHFVSRETFLAMVEQGAFLEHQTIHGHLYGTSRDRLFQPLTEGRHAITDIDILGAFKAKALRPEEVRLIFVFPPSLRTLAERIRTRDPGIAPEALELRLARVAMELSLAYACDAFVVNDDRDAAIRALEHLIDDLATAGDPPAPRLTVRVPALGRDLAAFQAQGETALMAVRRTLLATWWEDHPFARYFDLPGYTVQPSGEATWEVLLSGPWHRPQAAAPPAGHDPRA